MKSFRQTFFRLLPNDHFSQSIIKKAKNKKFPGSEIYWENRYRKNGNSGNGSYGIKAEYKAAIINRFVAEQNIVTVIELGCGDGNQLKQLHFKDYMGFDVSPTAI